MYRDYWEDIGTIKSFYEANLALVEEVSFLKDRSLKKMFLTFHFIFDPIICSPVLVLVLMQHPKFEFYDQNTPFYTSPRFLPPTKTEKCRVKHLSRPLH